MTYKVSFQYSEYVFCTNIAIAECKEDVEKHYSNYAWFSIAEATTEDVKEAERKGMPIVTIEHAEEQAEATEERKEEKTMMTREAAVDAVLDYFKENEEEFNSAIEALDSYNGYLGDDRYYEMDMLDEFYHDVQPTEFLNRVFYGYDEDTSTENNHTEFNPNREYFRYNGYGNLVSADYKDYSAHLDTWFTESYIENADSLYDIPAEVQTIIDSIEA